MHFLCHFCCAKIIFFDKWIYLLNVQIWHKRHLISFEKKLFNLIMQIAKVHHTHHCTHHWESQLAAPKTSTRSGWASLWEELTANHYNFADFTLWGQSWGLGLLVLNITAVSITLTSWLYRFSRIMAPHSSHYHNIQALRLIHLFCEILPELKLPSALW